MTKTPSSIVKTGGVASETADIEDVTRDTYGDSQPQPVGKSRDERIAEADRAAAAHGVPGIVLPDSPTSDQAEKARDEEFRRAEVTGDRIASRRDAEKARVPSGEE